jgi:predicted permease
MIEWMRVTSSRLLAVFRKQRLDHDFDDELKHHLESLTEEYEAAGMSRDEARRAAVLKLGHAEQLREENRDSRGIPTLETLARDLRFAVRTLWKSPGFTFVAILTMSLGIGLCSFLFSVLNGLMLRPLPGAREPVRLVSLQAPVTYPHFEHYRDESGVASAAAAFIGPVPFGVAIKDPGKARPERISGHLVSPEYFSTLGAEPSLGRFFDPAVERPGAAPTVVVSERFWRTRLNADLRAVGGDLWINGQRATIVGVAEKEFLGVFPANAADIFVPVTADAAVAPELAGDVLRRTTAPVFHLLLRLAPSVTISAAEAALDAQMRQLDEQDGKRNPDRDRQGRLARLMLAGSTAPLPREQRSLFVVCYGLLMGLILSFTCANLAGLMLARGGARGREIAICLSLGASRFRLIRQLLTESVILAMIGGAAGLAAAYGLLNLLTRSMMPSTPFPSAVHLAPDLRVTLVTFLVSALAGAGFGLMPALASTRLDLVTGLKETVTARLGRYRRFGMRNLFMVYQITCAMLLVLIMGFMIGGIQQGSVRDPGFDTTGLYLFSLDPARDGYSPDQSATMFTGLPERLARLNGVEGVTLADQSPFNIGVSETDVSVPSAGADAPEAVYQVALQTIGPNFFATLGVPLLRGTEFGIRNLRSDPAPGAILPAVINQTAAKRLFGDADPLGRRIRQGQKTLQVAGVVRYGRPAFFRSEPAPTVFLPLSMKNLRQGPAQGISVLVRARNGVGFAAMRRELEAIDSRLTMFNLQTMREHLAQFDRAIQYATAIYSVNGLFALILACVGLAGVSAQAVVRRRKEIGIRMALGAQRRQVLHLVMKEGAAMALIGSALGLAVASGLTRVLASVSAQFAQTIAVSAADPIRILGAPLLLISVAAIACYLPARRSAIIDPLAALREE